eukprot:Pompholyxophrys_punicea_v1_NODE_48_length_4459_cov_6.480699.p4 type:complete len:101 gc:universal NODE_48_length_4459_cov_6.480699:2553-2251(-)
MARRLIMQVVNLEFHNLPFGGKVFVMAGDFRQVLPIVVRGTRGEIVQSTLKYSYSWKIHITRSDRQPQLRACGSLRTHSSQIIRAVGESPKDVYHSPGLC